MSSSTQASTLTPIEKTVLGQLDANPRRAAVIAAALWPGHNMTAQGAGGAASRVLKRLAARGLARWTCVLTWTGRGKRWGWVRRRP